MPTEPDWRYLIQSYGYNLMEDDDKNFIAYRLNEKISSTSLKTLAEMIAMKHKIENGSPHQHPPKPKVNIKKIILPERKVKMLYHFQYEISTDKNYYVKNKRSLSIDILNKLTESKMFDYLHDQDKILFH